MADKNHPLPVTIETADGIPNDKLHPVHVTSDLLKLISNFMAIQINPDINPNIYLVNNNNFFIYNNDGDLIEHG